MKEGLDFKSGISKFVHAREYRRASRDAFRYAKVAFACNLSYCISYYFHHRVYQTEASAKPSFTTNQVHHRDLVSFAFALTVYANLIVHGLENIYGRVIRTARSLHRCFLSCKDAFPPPDMKGELAKVVWNEACAWEGADPDLIRQDDEASLFLCHMWPGFTRIISSYVAA